MRHLPYSRWSVEAFSKQPALMQLQRHPGFEPGVNPELMHNASNAALKQRLARRLPPQMSPPAGQGPELRHQTPGRG